MNWKIQIPWGMHRQDTSSEVWDEYKQVRRASWTEYQRARASAFFHAWASEENQAQEVEVAA
ncbi:MAG: hypothetical protein WDM89_08270 [Rhizomicrobium sp.]